MRGESIYKILNFLEDRSMGITDMISSMLESGYGATLGKIDYKYQIKQKNRQIYKINRENKRHLQKYLSKLKTEGFIKENEQEKVSLTVKGQDKLNALKKDKTIDKKSFKKEKGNRVIIISYDLPVAFNRERDILREILKILGFNLIHKSVWVGRVKLPKQFIIALEKLKILKFVEILEVTKQGTLKEI